jgi:hypothetical protein
MHGRRINLDMLPEPLNASRLVRSPALFFSLPPRHPILAPLPPLQIPREEEPPINLDEISPLEVPVRPPSPPASPISPVLPAVMVRERLFQRQVPAITIGVLSPTIIEEEEITPKQFMSVKPK